MQCALPGYFRVRALLGLVRCRDFVGVVVPFHLFRRSWEVSLIAGFLGVLLFLLEPLLVCQFYTVNGIILT